MPIYDTRVDRVYQRRVAELKVEVDLGAAWWEAPKRDLGDSRVRNGGIALHGDIIARQRPAEPSDNGRLSGTSAGVRSSAHAGSSPPPDARLGHVIRYIC